MEMIDVSSYREYKLFFLEHLSNHDSPEIVDKISLSGVFVQTSDIFKLFHTILHKYVSLQYINLSNTSIFDNDLEIIFLNLPFSVKTLDFSNNLIQGNSFLMISQLLSDPLGIEHLYFDNNELNCRGMKNLSYLFHRMTGLKTLSISHNFIKDFGMKAFANRLPELHCIEYLNLAQNHAMSETFLFLLQQICPRHLKYLNVSKMTTFDFYWKLRTDQPAIITSHVSVCLSNFVHLETLIWNLYVDQHIINSLYHMTNLQHFEISRKFIMNGTFDVFPFLANLKNMSVCGIKLDGIKCIIQSLPERMKNITIQHYNLSKTDITNQLSKQFCLESLDVSHSNLSDKVVFSICKNIPNKSFMKYLNFSKNNLGKTKCFFKIIHILPFFKNITYLSFFGNYIKQHQYERFLKMLCRNVFHNIITISFHENFFSPFINPFHDFCQALFGFEKFFLRQKSWNQSNENSFQYFSKWRPFLHKVDTLFPDRLSISNYNRSLMIISEKIDNRYGFLKFLSDENIPQFLHSFDLQCYILEFL